MSIGNVITGNEKEELEAIMDKIENGQEVFIEDTFEEVAIRIAPGEYYFSKRHGWNEYRIAHSMNLVCNALMKANEITKEEYEKY